MHGNMVTFQGKRNYRLAKPKFYFWFNKLRGNILIWECQNISIWSDIWKLNLLNKMFLTISIVNFFLLQLALIDMSRERIQTTRISHDINPVFFTNIYIHKKGLVCILIRVIFFIGLSSSFRQIVSSYFHIFAIISKQNKLHLKIRKQLYSAYFQHEHGLIY